MGLIFGDELLLFCGVSSSQVCEVDSEDSDGCLVPEGSLEMDGLERCYSIAPLIILLITALRSGVGVYPIVTERGLSTGDWGMGTLETD